MMKAPSISLPLCFLSVVVDTVLSAPPKRLYKCVCFLINFKTLLNLQKSCNDWTQNFHLPHAQFSLLLVSCINISFAIFILKSVGWGNGSFGKGPTRKHEYLILHPQHPCKTLSLETCICNTSTVRRYLCLTPAWTGQTQADHWNSSTS